MNDITAIILAAGSSRRMGQPKAILPWGGTTMLGQVAGILTQAGLADLIVVTGAARSEVETEVARLAVHLRIRPVYNPDYASGEMLSSIQSGLAALPVERDASLIVLGDQPQIEVQVVDQILRTYAMDRAPLIVPSFDRRRGHPWLIHRRLWADLLALRPPDTARDFLNHQSHQIHYIEVTTPSILTDVDTPLDYAREKPK